MTNLSKSQFQTNVQNRVEQFAQAKKEVKALFIGIDREVDKVFDSLAQWYILPELITQPIIINLFSLSGQGKTSLVRAISKALKLQGRFVEFDMAQNKDQSVVYSIEKAVGEESLKKARKKPIMLLCDEIQKIATLDKDGEPKETTSNQDYWTLLSDGKIPSASASNFQQFKDIILFMEINEFPLELMHISSYGKIGSPIYKLDSELRAIKEDEIEGEDDIESKITLNQIYTLIGHLTHEYNMNIRDTSFESTKIRRLYDNLSTFITGTDIYVTMEEFRDYTIRDLANIIRKIEDLEIIKSHYDLSNSVIFNCANLDSIYLSKAVGERRVNADFFRTQTESITIEDVKYALSKLFRPEQVARFGNTLISYLAFSCEDYRRIISQKLDQFTSIVEKETHGFKLKIDKTVEVLIYDNGVYPAQGTRPVFSTINQIQSLVSQLIFTCIKEGNDSASLSYDLEKKLLVITTNSGYEQSVTYIGDHDLSTRKIDTNLLAKNSVNAAAQSVVYISLFGIYPQRVVASYNSSENLFLEHRISQSQSLLLMQITFNMVNIAAQEKFFDDRASVDETSESATMLAANYVRFKGLGKRKAVMNPRIAPFGLVEYNGTDDEIEKLVANAYDEAYFLVEQYFDVIKALAIAIYENEGEVTNDMIQTAIEPTGLRLTARVIADDENIVEEYHSILLRDKILDNLRASHSLNASTDSNSCQIDTSAEVSIEAFLPKLG